MKGAVLPLPSRKITGDSSVKSTTVVGYLGQEPTTVVDLTEESPVILREGSGSTAPFI